MVLLSSAYFFGLVLVLAWINKKYYSQFHSFASQENTYRILNFINILPTFFPTVIKGIPKSSINSLVR